MSLEKLFSLEEAGEVLGTGVRFPRRLVAERRIRYTRVGKFVRIPESALEEFISNGVVEPRSVRRGRAA